MRSPALVALAVPALLLTSAPAFAAVDTAQPSTYVVRLAPAAAPVSSVVQTLTSRYGGKVSFTYTHRHPRLRGHALAWSRPAAGRRPARRGGHAGPEGHDRRRPRAARSTTSTAPTSAPAWTAATPTARPAPGVHAYDIDTGITARPHRLRRPRVGRLRRDRRRSERRRLQRPRHAHRRHASAASTHGMAKQVKLVGVRVLDCDGSGIERADHRRRRLGGRARHQARRRQHEPRLVARHRLLDRRRGQRPDQQRRDRRGRGRQRLRQRALRPERLQHLAGRRAERPDRQRDRHAPTPSRSGPTSAPASTCSRPASAWSATGTPATPRR